jgi:hypothetical protein
MSDQEQQQKLAAAASQTSIPSNFFNSHEGLDQALAPVVQPTKQHSNHDLASIPAHSTPAAAPAVTQQLEQLSLKQVQSATLPPRSGSQESLQARAAANAAEITQPVGTTHVPQSKQTGGARLMDRQWEDVQKKTFTKWVNTQLHKKKYPLITTSMAEGKLLVCVASHHVHRVLGWCKVDSVVGGDWR